MVLLVLNQIISTSQGGGEGGGERGLGLPFTNPNPKP